MFGHSSTADAKNNPGFMTVGNRESKARRIDAILQDYSGNKIEGKDILDVGCGSGAIADYFAAKNQVTGIDVVDQRTEEFKMGRFKFLQLDGPILPFRDESFDIVISNHVLAYIKDKDSHFRELARILRPGGIIYIATPNRYFPIDPHYKFPLLHYLPASIYNWIMKKIGLYREDVFFTSLTEISQKLVPLEFKIKDFTYEWFSHEFKPDPVKKLLEKVVKNPWASPTAAGFSGDFIQIDKPYLKLIGTKYLLVDRNVEEVLIKKAGDKIDEWNIHRLEDGISVFERKEPIKGAYFVPKLSSSPDEAVYSVDFDVKIVSTQEVKVTTQAPTNGLVVLPLYVNADWHAYKNGVSVPIHKYQNVLAAVEADGPATITIQYLPKFLMPGMLLTLLGVIILAVSALLFKFGKFRFGMGHSFRGDT